MLRFQTNVYLGNHFILVRLHYLTTLSTAYAVPLSLWERLLYG